MGKRGSRFVVENISATFPLIAGGQPVPLQGSLVLQVRDDIQLGSTRARFAAR